MMTTKQFNKYMTKIHTPLDAEKNQALKNSIINNISDQVNNLACDSYVNGKNEAIFNMWGASWLDGFHGGDLLNDIENGNLEGGIFEDLTEELKDEINEDQDDPELLKYHYHDLKLLGDHCFPGDVCVIDKSGDYRNISPTEVREVFETFRKNVNESRFTVEDSERYYNNKNNLINLVG